MPSLSQCFRLLSILLLSIRVYAEICVYPKPAEIAASDLYRVELTQAGKTVESLLYKTVVPTKVLGDVPIGRSTAFTNFSYSGKILVRVTRLDGQTVSSCVIRPLSYGIVPKVEGSSVSFELDQPRKISVEFGNDLEVINNEGRSITVVKDSLLLLGHPLETNIRTAQTPNTVYFGPGVHQLGKDYRIKDNTTLYLAGGAYVKGTVHVEGGKNIAISGRGILSGEDYKWQEDHLVDLLGVHDSIVEGITLLNAPNYNIVFTGRNNVIRDMSCISWLGQTDGPEISEDGLIEDCFFKVNDDALKLYHSRSTVRRCVIWILNTGAPFQLTWNLKRETKDIRVEDCDVIHTEWLKDHINRAVINSVHGGPGHVHSYTFDNIRVEGPTFRAMKLRMMKTKYAPPNTDFGKISHLLIRNMTLEGPLFAENEIIGLNNEHPFHREGWDHQMTDIVFENLRIGGRTIRSASEGNFKLVETQRIEFKDTQGAGKAVKEACTSIK
jgi:hypothetical protein